MRNSAIARLATSPGTTDDLFMRAVEVANKAISASETDDDTRSLSKQLTTDRDFGVAVFQADPANAEDYYQICFNGHALESAVACEEGLDVSHKIYRDHLKQVCDKPEDFIENPVKLDLVWLISRGVRS